ncbi:MAG: hypothetical protein J6R30_08490 [Bacteroidales bacterium]|nr:hypothetical protein [Bacteroidales bacterium]
MAITVDTYKITDAPNVCDKTIDDNTKITLSNVIPYEPCDVLNPVLVCNYSSSLTTQNYAQISAFGNRWYFINGVSMISGNRCILRLSVDVLKTYYTSIKNCRGTVLRAENPKHRQLYDSKLPVTGAMYFRSTLFPQTPFTAANGWNYLMYVVGKEGE